MTDLIKITRVEPRQGHWLRLWFSDGAVKDSTSGACSPVVGFAAIRDDRSAFEAVRVNPGSQTIKWPGDVDLDPDVLYGSEEPASARRSGG